MKKQDPVSFMGEKLAQLDSPQEGVLFLQSFFTAKERETLYHRFQIIQLLLEGKSQRDIAQVLGISLSQVSRGSAELQFGSGAHFFEAFFEKTKHDCI